MTSFTTQTPTLCEGMSPRPLAFRGLRRVVLTSPGPPRRLLSPPSVLPHSSRLPPPFRGPPPPWPGAQPLPPLPQSSVSRSPLCRHRLTELVGGEYSSGCKPLRREEPKSLFLKGPACPHHGGVLPSSCPSPSPAQTPVRPLPPSACPSVPDSQGCSAAGWRENSTPFRRLSGSSGCRRALSSLIPFHNLRPADGSSWSF